MDENADKRKLWREQKQAYRKNRKEYTIIFSLDEAKQVEGYAREKQMSVIEFIKAYIKKYKNDGAYILPKDEVLKNLIIEIRRVGNNINQIARYINTNKHINENDLKILEDRLSKLEKIIVGALTNPLKRDHQINSD
jgi:hypothetical protein